MTTCVKFDARGYGQEVHIRNVDTAFPFTHLCVDDVSVRSSIRPEDLTDVEQVHPFSFPPPFNRYLIPLDAHFIRIGTDTIRVSDLLQMARDARTRITSDIVYMAKSAVPEDAQESDYSADEDEEDEDDNEDEEDEEEEEEEEEEDVPMDEETTTALDG